MFKKTLLSVVLVLLALVVNAADGGLLKIKSTVKDCGDTLFICLQTPEGIQVKDTMTFRNGVMEGSVYLDAPQMIWFNNPSGTLTLLPGVPGEVMELSGSFPIPHVTGSSFYQQEGTMQEALRSQLVARWDLGKSIENDIDQGKSEAELENKYKELESKVYAELRDTIMGFITQHPDNEAIPMIISSLEDKDYIARALNILTDKVKNGRLKFFLDMLEQSADDSALCEGDMAPDFTLNTLDGHPFTLSSLRGRYVLLDFWGSWCSFCIKGFPLLKEKQKKYADRLVVVGVDCQDTEDKWRDAVKKYHLPWLQVYNPKTSSVLSDYKLQGFPTMVLIDPDGRIMKVLVGENPDFYNDFDSILTKKS